LESLVNETLTEHVPEAAVIRTAPVEELIEQAVELTVEYVTVPVRLAILLVPKDLFVE
jgi:hypothetical protein